jgi:hypothetical protein
MLALAFGACAGSPLDPIDGGWRNARHGYWVGNPPPSDPPWEPEAVDGSLLAFQKLANAARSEGERAPTDVIRMTFSSRCGVPLPRPEFLARHLRIGIPANVVRESRPVEIAGLSGWEQVFDADAERGAVRVKTVTFVANDCALDWVLTGREAAGFEEAEQDFDAWWGTLVVTPLGGTAEAAASRAPAREEAP